jgi:uncharacterized protein (DUF697 family)/tellurite resistance protein
MNDTEQRAILAIAVQAALADGAPDDRERAQIRAAAEGLAGGGAAGITSAFQAVLLEKLSLEDAAAALASPEARRFAYELAVTVAEADGVRTAGERDFLERLRALVGVESGTAHELEQQSRALLSAPLGAAPLAGAPRAASPVTPDPAALDASILNYAILNGALELLPESLATMAIIPLQLKLVYEVGQAHGYQLDRGHLTELLATVGVGAAGQAVEQVGRKLLGGILGSIGGRMLGGLGRQAASSGVAFATTYALGQLAREYYGGGRTLQAAQLQAVFQRLLGDAKGLAQRYSGQMAERARGLDVSSLASLVTRGP